MFQDIQRALSDIMEFTAGMDFVMYQLDAKCRATVERKFEVMRLAKCIHEQREYDLASLRKF